MKISSIYLYLYYHIICLCSAVEDDQVDTVDYQGESLF